MLNYCAGVTLTVFIISPVFKVSFRPEMLTAIVYISWVLLGAYVLLMLLYRWGWYRQQPFIIATDYTPATSISVIIPARNEEVNIANCIQSILAQDYPKGLLEIIVVDDHSDDNTADIVKGYSTQGVRYINLADYTDGEVKSYKKLALATGIAQCRGDLIITTDADCTAGSFWLKHIAAKYEKEKPVIIVAPVNFTADNSLVQQFQSLDFMSMQGITAATLQLKLGNMCNGANLAFEKAAYIQVGGYQGVDHIASGDDYLLMMKLAKVFPKRISYLKNRTAIVSTPPQPNWAGFLQQRIRWASKSGKYDDSKMTGVLLLVYLFNFSFLLLILAGGLYPHILAILAIKTIVELFYLYPVATFYGKRQQLLVFPLLQPLHIAYIITAGFLGFAGVYSWKGRQVK